MRRGRKVDLEREFQKISAFQNHPATILLSKRIARSYKANLKVKGNIQKNLWCLPIDELRQRNSHITRTNIIDKSHLNVPSRTVHRFMKNERDKYINWKKEMVLSSSR